MAEADDLAGVRITKRMCVAASEAADAWTKLAQLMKKFLGDEEAA